MCPPASAWHAALSLQIYHLSSSPWEFCFGLVFFIFSLSSSSSSLPSALECGRSAGGPRINASCFQMEAHRLGMCVHFIRLISNSKGAMGSARISRQTDTQHGGLSGSVDSVGSQWTQFTHTHKLTEGAGGLAIRWLSVKTDRRRNEAMLGQYLLIIQQILIHTCVFHISFGCTAVIKGSLN